MHMINFDLKSRQTAIRELLADKKIMKQEEVVKFLTAKGYTVTQSSVSRDFAEMGVVKLNGTYIIPSSANLFASQILGSRRAGPNLLVLSTITGGAPLVGVRIDQLGLKEIVGTISGDDTIFIATESVEAQDVILKAVGVTNG
jgi:transcriptional regulator of arginine metabolism